MKNTTKYALITLGSGIEFSEYAYLLVLEIPSGRLIDKFKLKHHVYEKSTKGFTGAFISKNILWVTTEAEILQFSLNPLKLLRRESFSYLNDVHHLFVDKKEKQILICNTGLDSVEILNEDFVHLKSVSIPNHKKYYGKTFKTLFIKKPFRRIRDYWLGLVRRLNSKHHDLWDEDLRYKHLTESILLIDFYKAFIPGKLNNLDKDLRYVLFRPHILHPNFISKVNGDYLVTLKNTNEIIKLDDRSTIISNLSAPHDGILKDSKFLITQAGSGLLSFCENISTVDDLINKKLKNISICDPNEGFVRGVDLFSSTKAIVAVSKRREIKDERPAYLTIADLENKETYQSIKIPLKYGTNPFSVINVSDNYL